jgi:hypothetical protein
VSNASTRLPVSAKMKSGRESSSANTICAGLAEMAVVARHEQASPRQTHQSGAGDVRAWTDTQCRHHAPWVDLFGTSIRVRPSAGTSLFSCPHQPPEPGLL